ncbi:DEAD-domain-containing protein [Pisolithus croceorrhizus]|nr:DEAD-domain-containing protein [Pisolithus croceorrhizus]KAI6133076.1 DEAD-domain-containing protein [Pisolithus croceorrhizus]
MDFIMTIDSDDENRVKKRSKKPHDEREEVQLSADFQFDLSGDPYMDVFHSEQTKDTVNDVLKPGVNPVSVDEIIERRKLKHVNKRKRSLNEHSSQTGSDDSTEYDTASGISDESEEEDEPSSGDMDSDDDSSADSQDDALNEDDFSSSDSESVIEADEDRKAQFFDSTIPQDSHSSFLTMNLSRPLQRALTSLGFVSPTPIQAATIPVALLGKDVVGNAVTGSGKTAAFTIPVLERLLYREKGTHAAATRCLILVPTRELAVQCFEVGSKLAAYTDIRFCLAAGGLSLKSQEAALRTRPDIVIATPGRLIDHLRNSPSFTLDALDVLVLDEADRMLSEGFADELNEIIKSCPDSRQTMLFSATMTDSIDELVKMSLKRPVRLFVDPKRTTARGLIQEFVRVRAEKEADRTALLVTLCKRIFKQRVIIFFRSKKLAHQVRVLFGLLDMNAEELHGDLSQDQRLKALQSFRDGQADFLMATDLASRGLDIKGIETVINYDMPNQFEQYLHRVGRTARAGKCGRSVTLVGEGDRKMLKSAIKHSAGDDNIRHRIVPSEILRKWVGKVGELKDEVMAVLQEEKEEKRLRQAEMELKKGQNMLEHEAEIFSRPRRTWFQTEKDKARAAAADKQQHVGVSISDPSKPKREKYAGLSRKAKRRKTALEAEKDPVEKGAIDAAIRSAKREARAGKVGKIQQKSRARKKAAHKVTSRVGSAFGQDLSVKTRREGIRARKGDKIGGMGRKGGKR